MMLSCKTTRAVRRFLTVAAALTAAGTGTGNAAAADDLHAMGRPQAPVVIIEYGAPTCPHCARFDLQALPALKSDYIDKGKVYYVFRVFPLSAADGAVEAIARCLPRDRYFSFLDTMYRNQSEWDPDGYDIPDVRAALVKMAGQSGLSPARTEQCIGDPATMDRINHVAEEGTAAFHLRAVPTFVINKKVIEGFGGWPELKAEIDALLAKH